MKLAFGDMSWQPDKPVQDNPGLNVAANALPAIGYWRSIPGPKDIGVDEFDDMNTHGWFIATGPTGVHIQFVGMGQKLWRVDGTASPPVDVSRDGDEYAMEDADRWSSAQYNNLAVTTNFRDLIQAYDLAAGGPTFDDLQPGATKVEVKVTNSSTGEVISDTTTTTKGDPQGNEGGTVVEPDTPVTGETTTTITTTTAAAPRARYVAVIRQFVCVASTWDYADLEVRYRVRWHGVVDGIPDPTQWDLRYTQTQAGFQDLMNVGAINGYTGGQFGLLICERGIVLQQFSSSTLWTFSTISSSIGTDCPGSVVQMGAITYFLAKDGWYACDGSAVSAIGKGQIDNWFLADYDLTWSSKVWSTVDVERGLIMWAYPGQGNVEGEPNRILVYHPGLQRWSILYIQADIIGSTIEYGLDLNNINDFPDLNTDTRDLNDPRLWSENIRLGMIVDGIINAFTGEPLTATFELSEMELIEGCRTAIYRVRPTFEGGSATFSDGKREQNWMDIQYSPDQSMMGDGSFRVREISRYHRPVLKISGSWNKVSEIEIEAKQMGQR